MNHMTSITPLVPSQRVGMRHSPQGEILESPFEGGAALAAGDVYGIRNNTI